MDLIGFRSMASLFILCSVLTSALCCDWLNHYSDLRNSSIVLIESMANSKLLFIRDCLEQIYDLYRHNDGMLPAAWDSVKTTDFLESINRQIVELDKCVSAMQLHRYRDPSWTLNVRHCFKDLKNQTLDRYGGSRDGWELLRRETKPHLIRLDLLGNQFKEAIRR
ncbi:interferon a3-like [Girardinichthys multiradiatus]|uniref:interferon a3-like n=1 Tax=Girardinichthys multiradiatus TaxID=208333 RepID=UPI001FAD4ADF|nr:interferon a3-like [Girardinichthys multiradiatus]